MSSSSETSSSYIPQSNLCSLCGHGINLNQPDKVWKQVQGWVGGPKKDHMRLREDTGRYAHDECVQKVGEGQAVDQPSIFDDEPPATGGFSSWSPEPWEL